MNRPSRPQEAEDCCEFLGQLTSVRIALDASLAALEANPTPARAAAASIQLAGAQMLTARLKQRLAAGTDCE